MEETGKQFRSEWIHVLHCKVVLKVLATAQRMIGGKEREKISRKRLLADKKNIFWLYSLVTFFITVLLFFVLSVLLFQCRLIFLFLNELVLESLIE